MPLDPEKVKRLIALKNAAPKRKTKGVGGKTVDTSIRTYETWFALHHRMMNQDTRDLLRCQNPNCLDPRSGGILVVEVNDVFMCRYCFLDGWQGEDVNQEKLVMDS